MGKRHQIHQIMGQAIDHISIAEAVNLRLLTYSKRGTATRVGNCYRWTLKCTHFLICFSLHQSKRSPFFFWRQHEHITVGHDRQCVSSNRRPTANLKQTACEISNNNIDENKGRPHRIANRHGPRVPLCCHISFPILPPLTAPQTSIRLLTTGCCIQVVFKNPALCSHITSLFEITGRCTWATAVTNFSRFRCAARVCRQSV